MVGAWYASELQSGDRYQHWGAHRSLCISRTRVRSCTDRYLHQHRRKRRIRKAFATCRADRRRRRGHETAPSDDLAYLDGVMVEKIAREYDRGRLLLIGTTNLDAAKPVVWNIGAIAKSHHPRAMDLIRRVLLASA